MEKNSVSKAKGTKGAAAAKGAKKAERIVKDKKAVKAEKAGKKQYNKGYEKGLKRGGADKLLSKVAVMLALTGAAVDILNDVRNKKEAEKAAGEEA